ncbi:MAM domain-containing glycosylphosphatidylinositol anchor protein 2-like [Thalassophryne amazonica]|uniref:MAM domain-containing glycosylphosphatidylinositol anchor protein 2-like n=1 Tax=Thalassophryne amazonica TaxID=390379 RepID=UPI0014717197|nr:MAM domain-containing glycosylphosphatidylinositol anchor protein 2-like [Thalassophryne amazonica]
MKTIVCFGLVLSALCAAGEVFLTEPGMRVTIKCGGTPSNRLKWMDRDEVVIITEWNGLPRKGGAKIAERSKLKGINLEISAVTEDDAGAFICVADGTSHRHTLIVVSTSVSPSADLQLGSAATLQCQVKGLSPDITVEWERPDGSPGGPQTVQLQSVTHSDKGNWVCKFSYEDKVYRRNLNVRVEESTIPSTPPLHKKTDVQAESACHNCTDPQSPNAPLPPLLGLSWWIWVVLGACVLVLVLLMVCVIVLYKRMRKQKRRFQKMQLPQPRQYCQCARPTAATAPRYQGRRGEKPQPPLMV